MHSIIIFQYGRYTSKENFCVIIKAIFSRMLISVIATHNNLAISSKAIIRILELTEN